MMKNIMLFFMSIYVMLYRLTGGTIGGRVAGNAVLLLTATGRKSGRKRTTPAGYIPHDAGVVVCASNGGAPKNPGWYHNVKANPQVEVQIKREKFAATAEVLEGEAREEQWQRFIQINPAYARYEKQVDRVLPVILLRR